MKDQRHGGLGWKVCTWSTSTCLDSTSETFSLRVAERHDASGLAISHGGTGVSGRSFAGRRNGAPWIQAALSGAKGRGTEAQPAQPGSWTASSNVGHIEPAGWYPLVYPRLLAAARRSITMYVHIFYIYATITGPFPRGRWCAKAGGIAWAENYGVIRAIARRIYHNMIIPRGRRIRYRCNNVLRVHNDRGTGVGGNNVMYRWFKEFWVLAELTAKGRRNTNTNSQLCVKLVKTRGLSTSRVIDSDSWAYIEFHPIGVQKNREEIRSANFYDDGLSIFDSVYEGANNWRDFTVSLYRLMARDERYERVWYSTAVRKNSFR